MIRLALGIELRYETAGLPADFVSIGARHDPANGLRVPHERDLETLQGARNRQERHIRPQASVR
jgi:hypothetical protein